MIPRMGRRRAVDLDLPPRMFRRYGRYYYGRAGLALGADKREALLKYAELETGLAVSGTFADAARAYREQELRKHAPKTQREYSRQLNTLCLVFGLMPMPTIRPVHVVQYMRERPSVAALREKALMSAVWNWAREYAYTDAANPCTGIRRARAKRRRYVTDAELADALNRADPVLAGFLELCYLTGQRPGDVLKMRRQDVQDGALHVTQAKTGNKVRIEIVGPLAALLERLMSGRELDAEQIQMAGNDANRPARPIASVWLIHDARGQRPTLGALRKRHRLLDTGWQMRDLRAKAASDMETAKGAQNLLGHSASSTTDGYIRQRVGQRVQPIMRKVKE